MARMKGDINVGGIRLPMIEGDFPNCKKVILVKCISEIHEKELKRINEVINNNKSKFKYGIDLIDIKCDKFKELIGQLKKNEIMTQAQIGNAKNIYALSAKGYAILLNIIEEFNYNLIEEIFTKYFEEDLYKFITVYRRQESIFFNLIEPTISALGYTLERQKHVAPYRIDGYIPELKLAIEYDENNHEYYDKTEEQKREAKIVNALGCEVIRITNNYDISIAISKLISKIFELSHN